MRRTPRQQEIKAEFERIHGAWDASWEGVLDVDSEFLSAYLDFAEVPHRKRHLDDKQRALVGLAVDAAVTHLHAAGIRRHIAAAREAGASNDEILEVLQCTATLSIHAMNVGMPILVEVLTERGERPDREDPTAFQDAVKAEFTRDRGYWNPTWDEMLEFDPELLQAYTRFSSHPWRHGSLGPMMREFIYIAFDTSATHLYRVGLKLHIENALDYGATPEQIIEIMEIASAIGIRSVTTAMPVLREFED